MAICLTTIYRSKREVGLCFKGSPDGVALFFCRKCTLFHARGFRAVYLTKINILMAKIFTGTLVATTTAGAFVTGKSVWLNAKYVHAVRATTYDTLAGVATAATLVEYLMTFDGTDWVDYIFSGTVATMNTAINAQPAVGPMPDSVYLFTVIPEVGANYTITVNTDDIWFMENTGTAAQAYVSVWNSTKDLLTTYKVSIVGEAAAIALAINN